MQSPGTFVVFSFFLFSLIQFSFAGVQSQQPGIFNKESLVDGIKYPGFCTIFCFSKGESVFFGNNEDWKDPNTFLWVKPPSDSTLGVVYLGFENLFPQGGINEKGLAFDANALPGIKLMEHPELLKPYQAIVNTYIMQKCATVEEAIEMARSYDWSQSFGGILRGQFLLADASGSDEHGEIVFTRKPQGDGYLISTNFNRAYPENKFGSGKCWRYNTASNMLDALMKEDNISVDLLVNILNAVHVQGKTLNTLYSNIFDLQQGVIYLYYWHQFDHPVSIDVSECMASISEPVRIESLFNEETLNQANAEYRNYQNRNKIIFIAIALALLTFVLIIILRKSMKNRGTTLHPG